MQQKQTFADNFPENSPADFQPGFQPPFSPHPAQATTVHPSRFTGDGRTYFRFWLVNVLLAIVTLGLYKPLARRRTAQYFYEHSQVAGSPLEFTARKRSMVVGFIVALVLAGLFRAGQLSGLDAIWALTLALITLWTPFAWTNAMRFRLANTRWRGLRLQFAVRWQTVYRAYWPMFAQSVLILAVLIALWLLAPFELEGMFDITGLLDAFFDEEDDGLFTASMGAVLVIGLALFGLLAIRMDYNLRDLLVRHVRLGAQTVTWQRPKFRAFLKIWLMAGLLWLAALWVVDFAGDLIFDDSLDFDEALRKHGPIIIVWTVVALALLWFALVLLTSPARAYYRARIFQLIWNRVEVQLGPDDNPGQPARFACNLKLFPYLWLRFKNALLRILTLGFYGPLATLSEYRMKLESVTLHAPGDLDHLTGEMVKQQASGIGDALADSVGLELIG